MKIAFLNLCHCDPEVVARVSKKLTANPNFDMYIHVDAKTVIEPFVRMIEKNDQIFFVKNRKKVYWGGYNAIEATFELLKAAMKSSRNYDYFVLLQNLDYPIRSNAYIERFFIKNKGKEFIRGCNIAKTKDWHYKRKYKIYNQRDNDFYLKKHTKVIMHLRYLYMLLRSITTVFSDGVIREFGEEIQLYYGTAQWAVTRDCVSYIIEFHRTHPKFNKTLKKIQFPDEEYFHTAVHNSPFKYKCVTYDEPEKRWLVNWRNLHYFEFPKSVMVFEEKDFEKIMKQDALFIRKVKTGISDKLMDKIDLITEEKSSRAGVYGEEMCLNYHSSI